MKNHFNKLPSKLSCLLLIMVLINFNLLAICYAYEFNFFENFSLNSNETNFTLNKTQIMIDSYNLTIEKDKLNLEYFFNNQNLIGENINIKISIFNKNQTEIKSLIDQFNINQDNIIYRNLKTNLTKSSITNLKGNCSILFTLLPNEEILLKRYFFINNSLKESEINKNLLNKKNDFIFYFSIFIIFLIIIIFTIKKQRNLKKTRNSHFK